MLSPQISNNKYFDKYTTTQQRFQISIPKTEIWSNTNDKKYTIYKIHVFDVQHTEEWVVARRYSEFLHLHRVLRSKLPKTIKRIPFPRKRFLNIGNLNNDFIEMRRVRLEKYISRIIASPSDPTKDLLVERFLNVPNEPDNNVFETYLHSPTKKRIQQPKNKIKEVFKIINNSKEQQKQTSTEQSYEAQLIPQICSILFPWHSVHSLDSLRDACNKNVIPGQTSPAIKTWTVVWDGRNFGWDRCYKGGANGDVNNTKWLWMEHQYNRDDTKPIVLYFHGGGLVSGNTRQYKYHVMQCLDQMETSGVLVDYRLSPENSIDDAIHDSLTAFHWMVNERQIEPNRIVFVGDGAGATLALLSMITLRDRSVSKLEPHERARVKNIYAPLSLPSCALLFSPWVDLTCSIPSGQEKNAKDYMLPENIFEIYTSIHYSDLGENAQNYSPLFNDLRDIPPMFITGGSNERLIDEIKEFANKAEQCVETVLEVKENMPHAYVLLASILPEAHESLSRASSFAKQHINHTYQ